ncbi:TetR/AcrR family transcriptional regulator [Cryptosporangium aurantiacum]|uniref:Transcriptional regulator, TetR family n=1 Tax=Cryptosporangium aurantiacum TaxID=134849 RepID=A0A1M7PK73_9ACTN|nr:TetR/AcrR family transcriptional regulator [Cryptosporangium aurantiacum]SHN17562.1 transcriptional regulator, TetR family [Cryptosporangium aurantiacum]
MTGSPGKEGVRRDGYGPTSPIVGERGARTRRRIVAETLTLFETQGFHGTSVEGIAKAAGTSRATLYQYFASKEEIFVELLDECGSALMRVVRRIGPLGPTRLGFDNLHWWLGEWTYVHDKYATMFAQWAGIESTGQTIRPLVLGFSQAYDARIARRLETCELHGLAPTDAAIALTSIMHRFNYFRHLGLISTPGPDTLLDGLAVTVQLVLFPETPPDVFPVRPSAFPLVEPHPAPPPGRTTPHPDTPRIVDRTSDLRPRAARTARRLIDAGAVLFAERGYHATAVDDIAAASGHARGTFYKYFDEKLDLLLQLTLECGAAMGPLAASFAALDPADPDRRPLRDWLTDYLAFRARYVGVLRAWLEGTSRDPRLLDAVGEVAAELRDAALAVFARADRPYPIEPPIAAAVLGALLERMPEAIAERAADRPDAQIVEVMAAVIERGLLGASALGIAAL